MFFTLTLEGVLGVTRSAFRVQRLNCPMRMRMPVMSRSSMIMMKTIVAVMMMIDMMIMSVMCMPVIIMTMGMMHM